MGFWVRVVATASLTLCGLRYDELGNQRVEQKRHVAEMWHGLANSSVPLAIYDGVHAMRARVSSLLRRVPCLLDVSTRRYETVVEKMMVPGIEIKVPITCACYWARTERFYVFFRCSLIGTFLHFAAPSRAAIVKTNPSVHDIFRCNRRPMRAQWYGLPSRFEINARDFMVPQATADTVMLVWYVERCSIYVSFTERRISYLT